MNIGVCRCFVKLYQKLLMRISDQIIIHQTTGQSDSIKLKVTDLKPKIKVLNKLQHK